MNTTLNKKDKLFQNKLKSLLTFKNDNEKYEFEVEVLHLNIIDTILEIMREENMNKAELAKQLKTSKSYITQLFSGDKLINLKMLANLQRIFKVKFNFGYVPFKTIEEFNNPPENIIELFDDNHFNINDLYSKESEPYIPEILFPDNSKKVV